MSGAWTAVVVYRGRGTSKTRLELVARSALAEAFLLDTLAAVGAAEAVGAVVLITSDMSAAERAALEHPGLHVVGDPGQLNPAVAAGIAAAQDHRPGSPVIALTADLPALTAADLDAALAAAGDTPAMVGDRAGSGTTALLLPGGAGPEPAFGLDSREKHVAAGYRVLGLPESSTLRLDVDTVDDLRHAESVGVGAWTARELADAA
ncbi:MULTISPECIES: 2-phospho-L-lactate guanylyltransferase [unclassified Rathayibacter]|uniref:2-phospho-L-lactate guanylyltransferase n=1 Tax=unclassified Rathayibacter TaxID=2609250 RepID=UPI0010535DDC|nr:MULTISPECIES: 2-phospho-L-lactate guanylyltransferase [unclassified Rathayibacter]MCJ1703657.1 2-phospho-L-lactate guanylyltransferase [Rathayibacter sp. VKM Ac-2926]TCL78323.1 2-phospho-L-lactate guanylyltransferase [Rathayibacter sp. PhB192]TCM23926.1 2-phospho-L-lactate guanylyltransferase [Rathayibacter sp. PhB179]